jgi:hypothetical protein
MPVVKCIPSTLLGMTEVGDEKSFMVAHCPKKRWPVYFA